MRTVVGYLAHLRLFGLYFWALGVVFRQILSVSFRHVRHRAGHSAPAYVRNTREISQSLRRRGFALGRQRLATLDWGSVSRAPPHPPARA